MRSLTSCAPRAPGELFSDDDLYITEARLVVVETTNHIYNPDVFKVSQRTAPPVAATQG